METVCHMCCTGYIRAKSPMALQERRNPNQVSPGDVLTVHDTLSLSPAVEQWGESARILHISTRTRPPWKKPSVAFRTARCPPSRRALSAWSRRGGHRSVILWSHLDRQTAPCAEAVCIARSGASVPLVAYNVAPLSPNDDEGREGRASEKNKYHSNVPAFAAVHRAESFGRALSALPKSCPHAALLLCSLPAGSDMVKRALTFHLSNGGNIAIHVREWQRLTGDCNFESLLTQHFHCGLRDVVELPSWGTNGTILNVWRRGTDQQPLLRDSTLLGSDIVQSHPA